MTTIEKSVDVTVPVSTAYNQWTQFESFPHFMEGVEEVVQLSDTRTHWRTRIAGAEREFDAEITEQHPDERIAWHTVPVGTGDIGTVPVGTGDTGTVDGPHHAGVVTFHRLDDRRTRVSLQMDYEPDSLTEKAGAALGVVEHRISGDLRRFKEFIEARGGETGGWRGDVPRQPQAGETDRPAGVTHDVRGRAAGAPPGVTPNVPPNVPPSGTTPYPPGPTPGNPGHPLQDPRR